MNNPNRARHTLDQLARLGPTIPTAHDLVYGPPQAPTGGTGGNPDPGRLPHGLDRVTDDWETGTLRTWPGVQEYLWDVADEWAELLDVPAPPVALTVAWLLEYVGDVAETADEDTWDATTRVINRAYLQVLRLTGRGQLPAGVSCPTCGTGLTRDATRHGAGDLLNCGPCRKAWTAREYIDRLLTLANDPEQLPDTFHVTVTQAARLFDVPYKTAYGRLRVRRDQGEDTGKIREKGRTVYYLAMFKPLTK